LLVRLRRRGAASRILRDADLRLAATSLPVLVGDDRRDDDGAFDDLLIMGVDVEEREPGRQNT
jgi:hypothetical protein